MATDSQPPLPDSGRPPTFDPLYGFPNGRKERVMIATKQQMDATRMPLYLRDYCAHIWLAIMKCRKENGPFKCFDLAKDYQDCQQEDYMIRVKEHEREKRLLARKHRLETKAENEDIKN